MFSIESTPLMSCCNILGCIRMHLLLFMGFSGILQQSHPLYLRLHDLLSLPCRAVATSGQL